MDSPLWFVKEQHPSGCDVREVHEENVHEEDVSEEDVREVHKVVREVWEVPQNVDIRVTAATVSPIEGGRRGRRQFNDQREPLQVVLAVLMPVMGPKELVPAMRLETLVPAMGPKVLVPAVRPGALLPVVRLTVQRVACRKSEHWDVQVSIILRRPKGQSYMVDMDGRFLQPCRMLDLPDAHRT